MRLKYSLLTLTVAGSLLAQGHGGGHHAGTTQASPPQTAGFTGINNPRVIVPPPIGLQPPTAGYTGINTGAYNTHPYTWQQQPTRVNRVIGDRDRDRRGRGSYGLPYYPIIGYGSPWYDSSAYVPVQEDTSAAQTAQVTANLLGEQIQRLTAEVESLRNSGAVYASPAGPPEDPIPAKPVVLVLHSGQKLELQNYAIMNGVLWDFSKQNSRRISLNSIDGPASAKATEEAGGSFPEASFATNPN